MNSESRGPAALFGVMAGVIILSTVTTYTFGYAVIRAHRLAAERRALIAHADVVLSTLTDAETGQRGFLLTSNESYLEPYHDALRRLPEELESLMSPSAEAGTSNDLLKVPALAKAKLDELEASIEARRTSGPEAAIAIVQSGTGKRTMDEIRAAIARFKSEQETLLGREALTADNLTRWRTVIFVATGLVNLLFLSWAYRRIRAAWRAHEAAHDEAEAQRAEANRQRDYFEVTLASIGDSVIVTDAEGCITFMNPIAETTTGWDLHAAHGRPAREIFRIYNEDTREVVESPVEKVIKSGAVVGLANHTILIARDGTELPIDDSGAPIRDESGKLYGVVLVFRDFSEHRRRQQELREARDAAETANRAKDKFLAMLSHELRTPLAPVLMTLNLWEASEQLPEMFGADVQVMKRNIELEARIIDDLLDLTRITRGLLSFSAETTDVHELIRHLASLSASEVHTKKLTLDLRLDATRHHLRTDPSRAQQVLWNVVRNAIKFTAHGGTITIASTNDAENNISITVRDNGIGMSPITIEKLFLPFEQADRDYRNAGLGLGLAISRALVDLLGGTISGRSEGLGKGSTFTLTFPTVEGVAASAPGTAAPAPTPRSLRILLVEDHNDTANALVRLLQKRGYVVERADSVASGIAAVARETFDLLLCDIGLPDGTGFELIQEVRQTCQTPAMALSGFGTIEDVSKSKEAGFGAHLTTPVNFQQLEAKIFELTSAG
jgi:PAS domain S-box-containing protein